MPLSPAEATVARAMSRCGRQLELAEIGRDTAMSHDAGTDGIDVYDFVQYLGENYGTACDNVPWERFSDQRASFYGCQVLFLPSWLLFRLLTWPVHRKALVPPPSGGAERLTMAHLAAVLERGEWFEPHCPS